ncbi:MAG: gliding motility lipoprotein GldH [Bacteroidota bacterium]|nr:gliding motility lipoprotein GldH [Bacteroidota bacterium]
MNKSRIRNSILIVALLIIIFSCDSNRVFEQNIEIPDSYWNRDSVMYFSVDITDTLLPHSIFINLRHESKYPKRNLYLFINTYAPSGFAIRDTFEIILANEKGRWYGVGLGSVKDVQTAFKRNVRFPVSGTYRFEIEQAMRYDKLPNIRSIGLRIETIE